MSAVLCLECKSLWLRPRERWRLYLSCDDPPETLLYCPECAAREFDDEL